MESGAVTGRDLFGAQQLAVDANLQSAKDSARKSGHQSLTMHQDSSQLENCLFPVRGIRDVQMRQGIKPVDFARQNRLALQQQSLANRERRISESTAALVAQQSKRATPTASRRTSGSATPASSLSARSRRTSTGGLRSRSETGEAAGGDAHGPQGAMAVYGPPKPIAKHNSFGRVPAYLRERQLELAEEQARQQAAREAALVPKGMRILSNEERQQILEGLDASKHDVEQQIQAQPLRVVTISQKRHQQALEARLQELEEATAIFSKPKVLVEIDPQPPA